MAGTSAIATRLETEFPTARGYLDVAARGLLPSSAAAAAIRQIEDQAAGRKDQDALTETVCRVRSDFGALVGANAGEVALTKNVSEGINSVANSLPWQAGDDLVLCRALEHPNSLVCAARLTERRGVVVRDVPPQDGGLNIARMLETATERTRLMIVSSVTFAPGFRADLARLGTACREQGIFLLVDAAQSVGVLDTDVESLKIDGLAVGTQKALLGPPGMGFLYCRQPWTEQLEPVFAAWQSADFGSNRPGNAEPPSPKVRLHRGAQRFEFGDYNYIAASAMRASLDLLRDIGTAAIERHACSLANMLRDGLESLGLPVARSRDEPQSNIVCAGLRAGTGPIEELRNELQNKGVVASVRREQLRFSFHVYNSASDVDRVLQVTNGWQQRRLS